MFVQRNVQTKKIHTLRTFAGQCNNNNMLVTVFDVETTGLPPRPSKYKRYPDPMTEYTMYDKARVVELAYTMYAYDESTHKKELVRSVSCLINPYEAFVIENTWIHGISHKTAVEHGYSANDVLVAFLRDVERSDKIVAHNLEFDYNIVLSECYRIGLDPSPLLTTTKRCTMKYEQRILGLVRFPKLVDLYNNLCGNPRGEKWTQTHRALDDTEKCADVYFELHRIHAERSIIVCA